MITVLIGYVVPTIHVLACLFLIVVVLLQTGKGADIGAVFGGGSQTLFGSGGAGNFLTRLTTGMAITFMVTSLILTWGGRHAPHSTLLQQLEEPAVEVPTAGAPAAGTPSPEAPAAGAPAEQKTANVEQVDPGAVPMQIQVPPPAAAPPSGGKAPAPAPAAPAPAPAAPAANP